MKLYEYQAKNIFKDKGIPIPQGALAWSSDEACEIAAKLNGSVVLKAQVLVGGRGKAGGVCLVKDSDQATQVSSKILGMDIKGLPVKSLLVEEAAQITKEFYLSLTVDRSRQKNILIFTDEGGVEIEELALSKPSAIHKYEIQSPQDIDAILKDIKGKLNLDGLIFNNLLDISKKLSQIYFELDCQLAEINPLVLTREDKLIALDAKLIIDDNALFRHEGIASLSEVVETDAIEAKAHKKGIAYVRLQGDVGVIGNGAGLVMATMDEVARAGCAPANFLDIGGGAKAELMKNSLEIVLMDPQVKGIFINIFGGITRCDEVAGGIISAFADKEITLPIVIRLQGTRCRQAKELLEGTDFNYIDSMEEGARKIASLVGES